MKYPIVDQFIQLNTDLHEKIKGIYLFGSRAKGTERLDSDYDLLLIVRDDFSLMDKDKLYEKVMDILLNTGQVLSLKIFKKSEFAKIRQLNTSFIKRKETRLHE